MTTIPELFERWKIALSDVDAAGDDEDLTAEMAERLEDVGRQIAEAPAASADDWTVKVAVMTYCDPGGDGPIHRAVACQALTALGLTRFLPRAA